MFSVLIIVFVASLLCGIGNVRKSAAVGGASRNIHKNNKRRQMNCAEMRGIRLPSLACVMTAVVWI